RPARSTVATELRVGGQGRLRVAGHVDLRHDRHAAPLGVAHDRGVLAPAEPATLAPVDLGSAADGGQFRPLADRDPPALVVGQVQVQIVDLVPGDPVDVPLDGVGVEEVPGDVQHRAAVGVARVV